MGKLAFLTVMIVLLIVVAPVALIWSINTLFPVANIPLNIETWLAAVVIGGVLSGRGYRS